MDREGVEDSDGKTNNKKKRYPVKMENKKMIAVKTIDDEKVKKEIEERNNCVKYGKIKELEN